jgi:SSS family solute:Na+ symporter
MLGLFLLGITSTVKSFKIPLYSVLFGVIAILWMTVSPYYPEQFWALEAHAYLTIVFGTAVIFILGFVLLWAKNQNLFKRARMKGSSR